MLGQRNIVGFLVTGSGVMEYQLSFWACFVPRGRRLTAKPAQFASVPKGRFAETFEMPAGIFRSQERDGLRATRIGNERRHTRRHNAGWRSNHVSLVSGSAGVTADNGFGTVGSGLTGKPISVSRRAWHRQLNMT